METQANVTVFGGEKAVEPQGTARKGGVWDQERPCFGRIDEECRQEVALGHWGHCQWWYRRSLPKKSLKTVIATKSQRGAGGTENLCFSDWRRSMKAP